jgi:hypothetical protein
MTTRRSQNPMLILIHRFAARKHAFCTCVIIQGPKSGAMTFVFTLSQR